MANAKELIERARMFDERADRARDPISRQQYREIAAYYRSLSVEHQEVGDTPGRKLARELPLATTARGPSRLSPLMC
jgi:hypothetical protein